MHGAFTVCRLQFFEPFFGAVRSERLRHRAVACNTALLPAQTFIWPSRAVLRGFPKSRSTPAQSLRRVVRTRPKNISDTIFELRIVRRAAATSETSELGISQNVVVGKHYGRLIFTGCHRTKRSDAFCLRPPPPESDERPKCQLNN